MTSDEILALLETKFPGTRKDGLRMLAMTIAGTTETREEVDAVVSKMTPEKVDQFVKDYRSSADSEIQKANNSYLDGLKKKYNLVEKSQEPKPAENQPKPVNQPGPDAGTLSNEQLTTMIAEAVKQATQGLQTQVAALASKEIQTQRREQLEGIIPKGMPQAYRDALISGFEGRQFEKPEDFNAYLEAQKQSVAKMQQELADAGLGNQDKPIFGNPNKEGVSAAVTAYIQEKADEANGKNAFEGKKL